MSRLGPVTLNRSIGWPSRSARDSIGLTSQVVICAFSPLLRDAIILLLIGTPDTVMDTNSPNPFPSSRVILGFNSMLPLSRRSVGFNLRLGSRIFLTRALESSWLGFHCNDFYRLYLPVALDFRVNTFSYFRESLQHGDCPKSLSQSDTFHLPLALHPSRRRLRLNTFRQVGVYLITRIRKFCSLSRRCCCLRFSNHGLSALRLLPGF